MGRKAKKVLLSFFCFLLTFCIIADLVKVQANDAVSNPDAVIDIVVNVPADYPGKHF